VAVAGRRARRRPYGARGLPSRRQQRWAHWARARPAILWVSRYHGAANGGGRATAVAVSPDGSTVFVTGYDEGATSDLDYATIAYAAGTGAELWVARYNGPGNVTDAASSMAVSPDGSKLYVTGGSWGRTSSYDYATIAYNAATGTRLWVKRYNGPADLYDEAAALAVSPNGARVYVTGNSAGAHGDDYATIGYDAATGARLWVRRYNGPANLYDDATSLALSPHGARVYITGNSQSASRHYDYATVAYTATGTRLWVKRYNAGRRSSYRSVAVSPAGKVYATGASGGKGTNWDYATIAYSAAGTQLWVKRYNGPANGSDKAQALTAPGGGKVYVTGASQGGSTKLDYTTIAYDAATGAQLWIRRYNGAGNGDDQATSVAARAGRVFVTGSSSDDSTSSLDYATVAYKG
jgi:hypothetical protein